jgi:hypothetical protein
VNHRKISTTLALIISCGLTVVAQTPQFNIIKPSTTGVPGEEVRVMKFDPAATAHLMPPRTTFAHTDANANRYSNCDTNGYRDAKA